MVDSKYIDRIVNAVKENKTGVALTGAGISAESGISTYRDPGGLWDTYKEGASGGMLAVLAAHPDKAPEILRNFFEKLLKAVPNPAHRGLAELENLGLLNAVITQNVDGLHRLAGSLTVYELHGSMYRLRCTACGEKKHLDRDALSDLARSILKNLGSTPERGEHNVFPPCEKCGKETRFDYVGFGEPVQDLTDAIQHADHCGWMMIVGTSGFVHPAASLPYRAKNHGAFIFEINPRKSELTSICDVFLKGTGSEVVPDIVAALKETVMKG